MSARVRSLVQQTWTRRLLLTLFIVGLITAVLNLFLVGPALFGALAAAVAAVSGSILDDHPKECR